MSIKIKSNLSVDQLLELTNLNNEIPNLVKKLGKDGTQIEAFFLDAEDALKESKTDEERVLIIQSLTLVLLTIRDCARKWSFDPFKPLRLKCDDIARVLDFKRYKKLRNL